MVGEQRLDQGPGNGRAEREPLCRIAQAHGQLADQRRRRIQRVEAGDEVVQGPEDVIGR